MFCNLRFVVETITSKFSNFTSFSYFQEFNLDKSNFILQKFGYYLWKDAPMSAVILDELSELVNEGKLYPITDSIFKVQHCDKAFCFLHAGRIVGKPVIYFK